MQKAGIRLAVAIIVSLMVAGYAHSAEKITTAGSSTVRPIVDKASKAFKKTHPDVSFIVGGGGSSHGVKEAGLGEVDIGQASRNLKEKEIQTYPDLVAFKVGLDGIAVIINSSNPVNAITKQQVQDIYTGKITNWKEIGGHDAPITLISKEEGRSTLELFLKYFGLEAKETSSKNGTVMVHKAKGANDFSTTTAMLIGPNKEAIAKVSTKPDSIAYVSVGTAQEIAKKGARIKLLELDGVAATITNVGNETYPLRRPLHVLTKGEPQGVVKEFIDFMLSDEGQQIVESLEFIKAR